VEVETGAEPEPEPEPELEAGAVAEAPEETAGVVDADAASEDEDAAVAVIEKEVWVRVTPNAAQRPREAASAFSMSSPLQLFSMQIVVCATKSSSLQRQALSPLQLFAGGFAMQDAAQSVAGKKRSETCRSCGSEGGYIPGKVAWRRERALAEATEAAARAAKTAAKRIAVDVLGRRRGWW
jgi:hypothetical protein